MSLDLQIKNIEHEVEQLKRELTDLEGKKREHEQDVQKEEQKIAEILRELNSVTQKIHLKERDLIRFRTQQEQEIKRKAA
jgi:chromosome segregation ATPase